MTFRTDTELILYILTELVGIAPFNARDRLHLQGQANTLYLNCYFVNILILIFKTLIILLLLILK